MTNSEKVKLMAGSIEDKKKLFDYLVELAYNESIGDDELPMLEFLKKEMNKPKSQIVSMSASLKGDGGVKV